jgi:hypothetical protein
VILRFRPNAKLELNHFQRRPALERQSTNLFSQKKEKKRKRSLVHDATPARSQMVL